MGIEITTEQCYKDVRTCPSCAAPKGVSCRRPSCPQLKKVGWEAKVSIPELINSGFVPAGEAGLSLNRFFQYRMYAANPRWEVLIPEKSEASNDHIQLVDKETGATYRVTLKI